MAIPKKLRTLGKEDRGATAIEYGLIAALIVVAVMGGLKALGGGSGGMWGELGDIANKYLG
ncbi:Flp family type IVb pilin [Sphingomicrobium arenosum]|uniref:Flp family type IVb pilin n=1 Tax=Sphingomicrobium arenosum TaxID=2233861 RepID=UPI0022404A19|nr:Flp family type IVb pilin [Sphingomicrobium arenosum]